MITVLCCAITALLTLAIARHASIADINSVAATSYERGYRIGYAAAQRDLKFKTHTTKLQ